MRRFYRRILLFTSLVAFLALAPLVIFYAMGYRAGLRSADPLPVGVAIVETIPRGANVLMNGEFVGRSPKALTNLPPVQTRITVKLEGFTDWEKTVQVEPGRTIELRDIRLFPDQVLPQSLLDDVLKFSIAPDRRLIAALTNDKILHIIDLSGPTEVTKVELGFAPKALLWSPSSSYLIATSEDEVHYLVDVSRNARINVIRGLHNGSQVVWDPRIPARILFINESGEVIAYNVVTGMEQIIARDAKSFSVSSRNVYILHDRGNIQQYTLQGERVVGGSVVTPVGSNIVQIRVTPRGQVVELTESGGAWLINTRGQLVELAPVVKEFGWSPDEKYIYLQPDEHTLYVYNVDDERGTFGQGESQLVTRLTRSISNTQWFAGGRHLVYQLDDEILISEIDTRDHLIVYQVDTTNMGAAHVMVGEDGEILFYLKKIDGQQKLVSTSLLVQ
jgi:WD40 repeat protein